MTDYAPGDKVEITLTGTIGDAHFPNETDKGFYFVPDRVPSINSSEGRRRWLFGNSWVKNGDVKVKVVEKAKPPVVNFEPGDIVKYVSITGKYEGGIFTVMNDNRVFSHTYGKAIRYLYPIDSQRFVKVGNVNE